MKIPPGLIAPLASVLYRLWCSTLRIHESGRESPENRMIRGEAFVVPIWHDELFTLIYGRSKLRLTTVVSGSRDGEYLARVLRSFGISAARGSSTRGGIAALLQAVRIMREEKRSCVITVDGPRGPRHVAKPGAVLLAHRVPAYIYPIRLYPERRFIFKSWDRFQLPLPFSKVFVVHGEPYRVTAEELTEEELERERLELERRLHDLKPPKEAGKITRNGATHAV